jgi:XTP/dITP diphosphohydrolase
MTSHPTRSSPGDSGSLSASLQELVEIVARLRSPQGGCPWDLQQTPESLIPFILEEAYEVIEAIRGDKSLIW